MPGTFEKISHGEPTFFVHKKVFCMFANNHSNDGRVAVWIPAVPGLQPQLIHSAPEKFFKPPYVGVQGWIGICVDQVSDEELVGHLTDAWQLITPKRAQKSRH